MHAVGFSHLSTDAKDYASEYRVFLAPASDDMVVDSWERGRADGHKLA